MVLGSQVRLGHKRKPGAEMVARGGGIAEGVPVRLKAQAAGLGFDPAVVFVPHPIQDRDDAEIRALADGAFEAVLELIREG